ncbi:alpha/beta fold hydrolase [Uniformispora flossi]|uniref:alpha/beta fold hydrolase n=1 Tax=Uniformispora flossi TaxID=3390723 RepID=UPI003C304186
MSRFVLIPGAGGAAWYWHRVVAELESRGHEAVAVELPAADEKAGLPAYTDLVLDVIGDSGAGVAVVAQSMGGFTAPMVCARRPVDVLMLVNAMVPLPGETAGAWWDATGSQEARAAAARAGGYPEEFDLATYFLEDVPPDLAATLMQNERPEAEVAFTQPCAIEQWPDVRTCVLAGTDDRFFPYEFQRRIAKERLGVDAEPVPGGHLNALSHPRELTERLVACLDRVDSA